MPSILPPFISDADRGYKFLRVFDEYYGSRGGTIGLYVEGGVAPYNWVVTGTDFTLEFAQTTVQYNSVSVGALAVIDNRETVTVTDAEGSEVEIIVCTCNPYVCCDEVDYALNPGVVPASISAGQTKVVTVIGGCPRFKWEIFSTDPVGEEEHFDMNRLYTNTGTNFIIARSDAPANTTVVIKVTDDCGSVYLVVGTGGGTNCCTDGYVNVAFDSGGTDETISSTDPAVLTIQDGCPPYTWEITYGTGYVLDDAITLGLTNELSSAAGTCGDDQDFSPYCIVKVTDDCGTEVLWTVKNVEPGKTEWKTMYSYTATNGDQCFEPGYANPCADYGTTRIVYHEVSVIVQWYTDAGIPDNGNWCDPGDVAWSEGTCTTPPCFGEVPPCGSPAACGVLHGGKCYNYYLLVDCPTCHVNPEYAVRQGWGCS